MLHVVMLNGVVLSVMAPLSLLEWSTWLRPTVRVGCLPHLPITQTML